jgi:hypothetical protein
MQQAACAQPDRQYRAKKEEIPRGKGETMLIAKD